MGNHPWLILSGYAVDFAIHRRVAVSEQAKRFNEDNNGPKAYDLALEMIQCCPH
jgi:hypothetical protein